MLDIAHLRQESVSYKAVLEAAKLHIDRQFPWYLWGTLDNFGHLDGLLSGGCRDLSTLIRNRPVADVGAADGDMSFFLEGNGVVCDIVDYGPTNMNGLGGARLLKEHFASRVEIHEINLDSPFHWPRECYGLVFFLGILYHLKNPFYVLESLSKVSEYAIVSTRIARYAADKKTSIDEHAIAYLLHESEANNDATNYWIFSDTGLKRIFHRSGWNIVNYLRVGNTEASDPASQEGDERAFALLKSKHF